MQMVSTSTDRLGLIPLQVDGRLPYIAGAWRADVRRTYGYLSGSKLLRVVNCARAPGVQAILVLRFGQWLKTRSVLIRVLLELVYFVLNGLIKIIWGIELPRAVRIGPGLYIGHFGGITVSRDSAIGSNCTISQNITLGATGEGENYGAPVIGDNTYIAPGARLFGKITIGNNVKIGANAVIYKDVPDNAIVVLNPGFHIISLKGNLPELTAASTASASQKRSSRTEVAEAQCPVLEAQSHCAGKSTRFMNSILPALFFTML